MAETTTPGKGPGNGGGGAGNTGSSSNNGGGGNSSGGAGGGGSAGGDDGPGGASGGGGGGGGTSGTSGGNGGNGGGGGGIPNYESQRQHLKELITRKRALEKRIVSFLFFGFFGGWVCLLGGCWSWTGCVVVEGHAYLFSKGGHRDKETGS